MLGRKGIEPSTALAIEFTAQPIVPANGTFLIYIIIFIFFFVPIICSITIII